MPGQLQRRQKKPHPAGLPMAVPFAASALLKAAELGPEELLARLSAHARTHVPDRSSHSPATSSPPTMDCSAGLISMGLARNLLQVTPTGSRAWCGSIIKSAMLCRASGSTFNSDMQSFQLCTLVAVYACSARGCVRF